MEERGRRLRAWLVASGVAAGATLGGIGVAAAQTDTSTSTAPTPGVAGTAIAGKPGPGGPHFGMGGGIHGEFVTPKDGGGYQTVATQVGEVTAVSASSITLKSADGYTKAYAVNDNTMVNAGNNGIDDVKSGDTVHVTAVVEDGKYRAVEVMDQTQGQRIGEQWRPAPPAAPAA
ncbi:MAG TPA: DUF5666 domain-containing protein [Acidimicrobiales bacterium]|nr:DUF5666 domain-containing protein [Acidimicrobiales bacterium]